MEGDRLSLECWFSACVSLTHVLEGRGFVLPESDPCANDVKVTESLCDLLGLLVKVDSQIYSNIQLL